MFHRPDYKKTLSEDEQMQALAVDIEKLKWHLTEQHRNASTEKRLKGDRTLKKSRSLEDEPSKWIS